LRDMSGDTGDDGGPETDRLIQRILTDNGA
jgi:hypothetical protein